MVEFTNKNGVGCGSKKTVGAVIAILAEAVLVLSDVEVAVTVTEPPVGTEGGAVYVVALPLAVCAGLNDPQAPALPHVTVQSTPALDGSFATTAVSGLLELTSTDEGGAGLKETAIAGTVMVVAAEIDFVLSAVEVAVTVTVAPAGTVAGAVYVVALPLAV